MQHSDVYPVPHSIPVKGKIGVLIEDHFDQTEFFLFNEYFPVHGYEVVYMTHLWEQPQLTFGGNPDNMNYDVPHVSVTTEINTVDLSQFKGLIIIGGYAADRLRYQTHVAPGQKNQSPAVQLLRRAITFPHLKLGTICHSLWLFCADPDLIRGKRVTCAHNIICDVENAGAIVVYENQETVPLAIDGNLITAKHPGVTHMFMEAMVSEIETALHSN